MSREKSLTRPEAIRLLESEMGMVLRRVRRAIAERARMVHPELSAAAYSMLVALGDTGPHRSSELAETFAIDKAAVSRQVQLLEDLGFITRAKDPHDGRAWLLSITPTGVERLQEVDDARRSRFDDRFEDWSVDDLADLVRSLSRYNASFG